MTGLFGDFLAWWVADQLRAFHRLPYTIDKAWLELIPGHSCDCCNEDSYYEVWVEYTLHGEEDTVKKMQLSADDLFKEMRYQR